MPLKLTKKEINGLFEAQKAGMITSDALQKIILAASQDEKITKYEEAPKQTWQGQEIYCKVDAFSKKSVSKRPSQYKGQGIYDDGGWCYFI